MSGIGKRTGPKFKVTSKSRGKGIISEPMSSPAKLKKSTTQGEMFVVERIIDKKLENGIVMFLIKWEGYPSSSNTWEPLENIPADLVREYNERICESRNGKKKVSVDTCPIENDDVVIISPEIDVNTKSLKKVPATQNLKTVVPNKLPPSEKRILYATNLENRVVECIQTITLAHPNTKNDVRKLVFVVKFEDSAESFAVDSSDAYTLFPSKVIEYYESIVNFF